MKVNIILLAILLSISLIVIGCQQQESDPSSQENDDTQIVENSNQKPNDDQDKDIEENQNVADNESNRQEPEEVVEEENDNDEKESTDTANKKSEEIDIHGQLDEESGLIVVDNPNSVEVMVNKQRKLPDGHRPDDLRVPDVPFSFDGEEEKSHLREDAATALEELFAAAKQEELELIAASGFRSYETQKWLYNYYVERDGQEQADKFSARPGTSEHQTGLAMDVTSAAMAFSLEQSFKQTPEGAWLADHAHQFGFIIRYPEGKEDITGYSYEPWHLRFVGEEIATEIYADGLTLEEFFGYGY